MTVYPLAVPAIIDLYHPAKSDSAGVASAIAAVTTCQSAPETASLDTEPGFGFMTPLMLDMACIVSLTERFSTSAKTVSLPSFETADDAESAAALAASALEAAPLMSPSRSLTFRSVPPLPRNLMLPPITPLTRSK